MNIIDIINQEQIQATKLPDFKSGDTVIVNAWIKDGESKRLQAFKGLVIAIRNRGFGSSFTVRKISHGEGVERVFQKYSPLIESVEIIRNGKVRRAKLYYLRDLKGKAARIKELIKKKKEG